MRVGCGLATITRVKRGGCGFLAWERKGCGFGSFEEGVAARGVALMTDRGGSPQATCSRVMGLHRAWGWGGGRNS